MNEEFHFNNALTRKQATKAVLKSNSFLGIDYPFKESSLAYLNKPLDIKNNVYLRFCFLLDFFSINLVDVLKEIVLRDASKDEITLLNDFKYNYNNHPPCKATLVNHVDEFIELLKKKKYEGNDKNLLLKFAQQRVVESYENDLFVGDTYELFIEWLIKICSYIYQRGIEINKRKEHSYIKVLYDYKLITLYTMQIWIEANHIHKMREWEKISVLPFEDKTLSEADINNFTDTQEINDWAYLLSNWEFYKKIIQDVIAYENFSVLMQLNIKLVKKIAEEIGTQEITIQAATLINRLDEYSYILMPLKQRRRNNKKEEIFEKIKNICLKSFDDYRCFLFCNKNIYFIVKLKDEHYKLLYYSCCLNVLLRRVYN